MKKEFNSPTIEIIELNNESILRTSTSSNYNDNPWDFPEEEQNK